VVEGGGISHGAGGVDLVQDAVLADDADRDGEQQEATSAVMSAHAGLGEARPSRIADSFAGSG
jgi:hypothetical protein